VLWFDSERIGRMNQSELAREQLLPALLRPPFLFFAPADHETRPGVPKFFPSRSDSCPSTTKRYTMDFSIGTQSSSHFYSEG
jgi:hypothetical protein